MGPQVTDTEATSGERTHAHDSTWRELACDEAVDRARAKYGARALRRVGADLAPYRDRPRPAWGVQGPAGEHRGS
jgi:hypothetical protein